MLPESPQYDVAVLGGGSAGYAAARTAASGGLRTVLLEGAAQTGGLCILRGCMPSKALLYAAEVLHLARQGRTWGLRIPKSGFHFPAVMARKSAMIADFAGYRRQQLEKGPFDFLRAQARFTGPHTLELTGPRAKPRSLTARNFILCTGSVTALPPCPGLEKTGFMTSDDALSLRALPRSLIVLGGGPIAVELAQFFCRMDVKVTLIQRSAHILRESDPDAAAALEAVLRREGVRLFAPTHLLRAFRLGRNKGIEFEFDNGTRRVTAENILVATGRTPNTAGLGLDRIGVSIEGGRIITNSGMRTSVPHVYAAGDCTGPNQIVHIAVEQGEVAARNILNPRRPRRVDDRLLIRVVFTEPQVASVGLTEKEAAARGIPILAASYPFADHGKSLIMEAKDGFVKLLADKKTGVLIGGACVGPSGGELIHEIVAAIYARMTARELAAMPHYHPTLAEIWTYPAEEIADRLGTD